MSEQKIALAYNDKAMGGTSDKVYHIALVMESDSWSVIGQWGPRGGALRSQHKAELVPYEEAKKKYDSLLKRFLREGYQPIGETVEPQVTPSGLAITSLSRDIKPPELLEEITNGEYQKFVDDPHYFMQDKSDGVSRGVLKAEGEIFGINKRGVPVPLPAELVAELGRIKLDTFQIDAELVGAKLVCRDLLVANEDISALTYGQRLSKLIGLVATLVCPESAELIETVETWIGAEKGPQLARSREARREGVVFKLIAAQYRAGRSGQHKKFKFIKTLTAIAGHPRQGGKESVDMFLWDYAANTTEGHEPTLVRCGTCSLIGKPPIKENDIVECAYLYAQSSGLMSQARILSVRDDVASDECTTEQLIYKLEAE